MTYEEYMTEQDNWEAYASMREEEATDLTNSVLGDMQDIFHNEEPWGVSAVNDEYYIQADYYGDNDKEFFWTLHDQIEQLLLEDEDLCWEDITLSYELIDEYGETITYGEE